MPESFDKGFAVEALHMGRDLLRRRRLIACSPSGTTGGRYDGCDMDVTHCERLAESGHNSEGKALDARFLLKVANPEIPIASTSGCQRLVGVAPNYPDSPLADLRKEL